MNHNTVIAAINMAESINSLTEAEHFAQQCYLIIQEDEIGGNKLSDNVITILQRLRRLLTSIPMIYFGSSDGNNETIATVNDPILNIYGLILKNSFDPSIFIIISKSENIGYFNYDGNFGNIFEARLYPIIIDSSTQLSLTEAMWRLSLHLKKMLLTLQIMNNK